MGGAGRHRSSKGILGERCASSSRDNTGKPVRPQERTPVIFPAGDDEGEPAVMTSEVMLFLLYSSGNTDKPKGLVHSQAGYLLFAALTHNVMDPSYRALTSQHFIGRAWNRCAALLHHDLIYPEQSLCKALLGHQPSRAHLPKGSTEEQHMFWSRTSQTHAPLRYLLGFLFSFTALS